MSKELEGLVRSQYDLYGRITRAYENLKKSGAANMIVGLVEARMLALDSSWEKFERQHDKLVTLYDDVLAGHEYQKIDLPAKAEEAYLRADLSTLYIRLRAPRQNQPFQWLPKSRRLLVPHCRIQLPQFSGHYEEWPSFCDLFHSIVGKDDTVASVEKLHYLKACLKGEAELLIRSLPTTGENYQHAWASLEDYYEDYYDNKRLLVRSYISQFTALQKLKGESASEMRKLYHCVLNVVGSLESIDRPITREEDLFVHLIVELLDMRTRREWENAISKYSEPPTYEELRAFLDRRLHTLESLQLVKAEGPATNRTIPSSAIRHTSTLHTRKQDIKRSRCTLCAKDHYLLFCEIYKSHTAQSRREHVEANNLCVNCLGWHKLNECSSRGVCRSCGGKHHTTLHDAYGNAATSNSLLASRPSKTGTAVLLATARVRVTDRFGEYHSARALVDQGSESSLISECLAQKLRLKRAHAPIAVFGIGGERTGFARGLVHLNLLPLNEDVSISVSALILPRLTLYEGGIKAPTAAWLHLRGLNLADPNFSSSEAVDIILGADVLASIMLPGLRRGGPQEPMAQETKLGWILSGPVKSTSAHTHVLNHQISLDDELPSLVRQFWQQEELVKVSPSLSAADVQCEKFFASTHTRDSSGRYIMRLPVCEPLPELNSTRHAARRAITSMERRFTRDLRYQQLYVNFMRKYEQLGHMSAITSAVSSFRRVAYLPHHVVIRESSLITKLRVVFDDSATFSSGDALNKKLLVGPNLLPPLFDLITLWRRHKIVLTADIEKMYRHDPPR